MRFRGEYYFLSNMYPCSFWTKDKEWRSVEHFYQAMKTVDPVEREYIRTLGNPFDTKKEGKRVTLRDDWHDIKLDVMEWALRRKFAPGSELHAKLCAIEEDIVEENTWGDTYWGKCRGKGENHLGRILMRIRDE